MKLRLFVPPGAVVELVPVPDGTPAAIQLVVDDGQPTHGSTMARGNIEVALGAVYATIPDLQQTPSAEAVTGVIGHMFDRGFFISDPSTDGRTPPVENYAMPSFDEMRDAVAVAYLIDGIALPVSDEAMAALLQSLGEQGFIEHTNGTDLLI